MSVEAEVASLKATVDNLVSSVAHQWTVIQKLSEHEQNDRLILYKLGEVEKKLDKHDNAETERSESHHERITKLESARDEFNGTYKAVIGGVALIASLVGGVITTVIGKLFTTGSVH